MAVHMAVHITVRMAARQEAADGNSKSTALIGHLGVRLIDSRIENYVLSMRIGCNYLG